MAILNEIQKIPFKGDEVIDVQFKAGLSMATIFFSSGKILQIHIKDDGIYSRKDYLNQVSKNNRDITIKNLLKD